MKLTPTVLLIAEITAIFLAGCDVVAGPMGCPGAGFEYGHTPTDGTIANPSCLPAFGNRALDGCGILVGADGIVIDPDHVHGWARITIEMCNKITAAFNEHDAEFSFDFIHFQFTYPPDWDMVPAAEKKKIAIEIAEYAAFQDGIWHEAASWYGWNSLLFPDFESAFSYEDLYCDRLGTKIGAAALRKGGNVTRNVTVARNVEFRKFRFVTRERALRIMEKGKGTHWDDKPSHMSIRKPVKWRSLDIGMTDGLINPVIIPVNEKSKALEQTLAIPVPKLEYLETVNLKMKLTVAGLAPKTGTIKSVARISGPVEPQRDYAKIVEAIAKDAKRRGYNVSY